MQLKLFAVLSMTLLLIACDGLTPEDRRKAMHLPPVGFKGDAELGRSLFGLFCIACHGQGGRGTQQGPPLVHETYRPAHHADLAFHMAISDGVRSHHWGFGDMKPIPDVTPEEAEHIIAFIRQEQRISGIQ